MKSLNFDQPEPVEPSEADARTARESVRALAKNLGQSGDSMKVRIEEPGGKGETVTIPKTAFRLFVAILAEMANGNAVRIIPHQTELTTQEAAELLNVSRPYLVRLLDDQRIPFHRVGTHRRILFKDVMAYKAQHRRARKDTLDRLSKLDQELGLR
jgi:excisionase family DNA binding protein